MGERGTGAEGSGAAGGQGPVARGASGRGADGPGAGLRELWHVLRVLPLPGLRALTGRRPGRAVARRVFPEPEAYALALRVRRRWRPVRIPAGADVRARGEGGVTLAHWALYARSPRGLAALLAAGADPAAPDDTGSSVLRLAAMVRDPRFLDVLLAAGADPDHRHPVTREPLLSTALFAPTDTQVRALLGAGADPRAAGRTGDTPLHRAALTNSWSRLLILLEAGADPYARNRAGRTFQTYAFAVGPHPSLLATPDPREPVRRWLRDHGVEEETNPPTRP